jgi:hypothetical protein
MSITASPKPLLPRATRPACSATTGPFSPAATAAPAELPSKSPCTAAASASAVRQSRFVAWGAITQLVTRRSGAQRWLARWSLSWSLSRGIAQIAVCCSCGRFVIGPDRYAAARHRANCAGLPGGATPPASCPRVRGRRSDEDERIAVDERSLIEVFADQ